MVLTSPLRTRAIWLFQHVSSGSPWLAPNREQFEGKDNVCEFQHVSSGSPWLAPNREQFEGKDNVCELYNGSNVCSVSWQRQRLLSRDNGNVCSVSWQRQRLLCLVTTATSAVSWQRQRLLCLVTTATSALSRDNGNVCSVSWQRQRHSLCHVEGRVNRKSDNSSFCKTVIVLCLHLFQTIFLCRIYIFLYAFQLIK